MKSIAFEAVFARLRKVESADSYKARAAQALHGDAVKTEPWRSLFPPAMPSLQGYGEVPLSRCGFRARRLTGRKAAAAFRAW